VVKGKHKDGGCCHDVTERNRLYRLYLRAREDKPQYKYNVAPHFIRDEENQKDMDVGHYNE
jgi:hypothetical protein